MEIPELRKLGYVPVEEIFACPFCQKEVFEEIEKRIRSDPEYAKEVLKEIENIKSGKIEIVEQAEALISEKEPETHWGRHNH